MFADDDDAARDLHLALRKGIERLDRAIEILLGRELDLDLGLLRREVVDAFDLDLSLARGILDGCRQRIGCRARRESRG